MLGPLYQDQQLLLHRLPDIRDGGQPLGADIVVCQLHTYVVSVVALQSNALWLSTRQDTNLAGENLCIKQRFDREATVAHHGVLQCGAPLTDSISFVLHRILLHSCLKALAQPAVSTLVSLVFVHCAVSRKTAAVSVFLTH